MGHSHSQPASDIEIGRMDLDIDGLRGSEIPRGSMTIGHLCTWLQRADAAVQNAPILDISWWQARAGLEHQFLLLRFLHADICYHLKLERAGKAILITKRLAIDKATFSPEGLTKFFEEHRLLFALLSEEHSAMLPPEINGPHIVSLVSVR